MTQHCREEGSLYPIAFFCFGIPKLKEKSSYGVVVVMVMGEVESEDDCRRWECICSIGVIYPFATNKKSNESSLDTVCLALFCIVLGMSMSFRQGQVVVVLCTGSIDTTCAICDSITA